jgi:RimJ/RimL family protein N-acetyltransferase
VARVVDHFPNHRFGFWAVEVVGGAEFVGFVGLAAPSFQAHFTPCIEIGWRLAFEHWGRGYATEAARAAVECGFQRLGLGEIVAFTVPANWRSRRVMERLGMTHYPEDDFDHPLLPEGHPLRRPTRSLPAPSRESDQALFNRQRLTATAAQMASTIPNGHAPCRNP